MSDIEADNDDEGLGMPIAGAREPEIPSAKRQKTEKSRNWCWTNFEMEYDWDEFWDDYNDVVRYLAYGEEICPETEKKHQQGWIQFINPKAFTAVRKLLGGMHIEACRGSEVQNDAYCSKDSKFKSWGEYKAQGHRTDLEAIKKLIDGGKPMINVADSYFSQYVRYHKGFDKYTFLSMKEASKAERDVTVEVVWGPTGTGKTRYAVSQWKSSQYKIHADELQWFDGYEGEQLLIIDEYDSQIKLTKLLGMLDRYQLRLPVKGSMTYAFWTRVIITSNVPPTEWHKHAKKAHKEALMRRINIVREMT